MDGLHCSRIDFSVSCKENDTCHTIVMSFTDYEIVMMRPSKFAIFSTSDPYLESLVCGVLVPGS